jgi:competence protein ComEC
VLDAFSPRHVVHNGQESTESQRAAQAYVADPDEDADGWFVLSRTIGSAGLTNEIIDPFRAPCGPAEPRIRALSGRVTDDAGWHADDFRDENNHSVVLRIDYGAASLLVTGDLEETTKPPHRAGIERLLRKFERTGLLDVDVYLVGHHGSHNGTTQGLVRAMSPEIAVISAGPPCRRDDFSAPAHGHPRAETIRDLVNGVHGRRDAKRVAVYEDNRSAPRRWTIRQAIYSTSWDGDVVLEATPQGDWTVQVGAPFACPPE